MSGRCQFHLADLDLRLPSSPPAEVVVCHLFRDQRLYQAMVERLKTGGLLAVAVLSEVDARPGPFRAGAGELQPAFEQLVLIAGAEAEGRPWLLARSNTTAPAVFVQATRCSFRLQGGLRPAYDSNRRIREDQSSTRPNMRSIFRR